MIEKVETKRVEEIDLEEIFKFIWSVKYILLGCYFIAFIVIVVYVKSLPDIYRSDVKLSVHASKSGGSALPGQLQGLASLAGVSVSKGGEKSDLALEVLKSRKFITQFVDKYDLLVPLMAAKSWSVGNGKLKLDEKLYDEKNNVWVRKVKAPRTKKPSAIEAYLRFSEILGVNEDSETGIITLYLDHVSPEVAARWLELLVENIDQYMRALDVSESQNSIEFLQKKLKETNLAEMKSIFYTLIEDQTRTIMLAEARENYLFVVVDPPYVPEIRHSPNRKIIAVILGVLVLVVMVFGALVVFYVKRIGDEKA